MKILFSMRHAGALRNFGSTVEELARRGHRIHLTFLLPDKLRDDRLVRQLVDRYPDAITHGIDQASRHFWLGVARLIRAAADYARYRSPEYRSATALRDRAASRVPGALRRVIGSRLAGTRLGLGALTWLLRLIEQALPPDPGMVGVVSREAPDVVLVTPLIDLGSDQVEYVKAARTRGLPCAVCVHSWDNLTNKGLIHAIPDRVFVWNDVQRREAIDLHHVPPSHVVVTGAPTYDQWFSCRPSLSREAFCEKVGLPPGRPYLLYLCSSKFIAPREAEFIKRWLRALRASTESDVREAAVLVRPHPRGDLRGWKGPDPSEFPHVVVWPPEGTNPVDAASKADYFDSLYYAAVAVGINTSAQIEAGIVGRQVYSIRAPEYVATQEGTLHFHYLLTAHGGLLHMAGTLDEHTHALAGALQRTDDDDRRLREFVRGFVRPHGLDVPATPLLASEIEALASGPSAPPERTPLWVHGVRFVLRPVAKRITAARPERHAPVAVARGSMEKKGEWVH